MIQNLVWMDLEMTGLDVVKDHILEAAVVITDANLEVIAVGPHYVIHQPQEILDSMNDWCKDQHGRSGLIEDVLNSSITLKEAEQGIFDFITLYCIPGKAILCGNSVWNDKAFIAHHMPNLNSLFHYRILDVTSFKEAITRWYPDNPYAIYKKPDVHRAVADVMESIHQLKYYKAHFFIP